MKKQIDIVRLVDGSIYERGKDFIYAMYDNVAGCPFIKLTAGGAEFMIPTYQISMITHGSLPQ
jgi:hypothetical protein